MAAVAWMPNPPVIHRDLAVNTHDGASKVLDVARMYLPYNRMIYQNLRTNTTYWQTSANSNTKSTRCARARRGGSHDANNLIKACTSYGVQDLDCAKCKDFTALETCMWLDMCRFWLSSVYARSSQRPVSWILNLNAKFVK